MTIDGVLLLQFIFFVVAGVVGAVILKSQLVKTQHEELEKLAETRGQVIDDLEKKLERQDQAIKALRAEIRVVRKLLTDNIAKETAERVVEALQERLK